jgi:hypothetical protein
VVGWLPVPKASCGGKTQNDASGMLVLQTPDHGRILGAGHEERVSHPQEHFFARTGSRLPLGGGKRIDGPAKPGEEIIGFLG